jgi:hypothetical protein
MHREVLVASFVALRPRVDGLFPVINSCLEKVEISINVISTLCMGIFFACGIVLLSANCSPKLVAEYLGVLYNFVETFFCPRRFESLILGDFPK